MSAPNASTSEGAKALETAANAEPRTSNVEIVRYPLLGVAYYRDGRQVGVVPLGLDSLDVVGDPDEGRLGGVLISVQPAPHGSSVVEVDGSDGVHRVGWEISGWAVDFEGNRCRVSEVDWPAVYSRKLAQVLGLEGIRDRAEANLSPAALEQRWARIVENRRIQREREIEEDEPIVAALRRLADRTQSGGGDVVVECNHEPCSCDGGHCAACCPAGLGLSDPPNRPRKKRGEKEPVAPVANAVKMLKEAVDDL